MSAKSERGKRPPEGQKSEKRIFSGRFIVTFLLVFLALCMIGELTVTIINSLLAPENSISYTLPLLIVPAFAACITVIIIYINNINNKQVDAITDAFDKITHGDFSVNLEVPRRGRYRQIYLNFNKMVKELSSVQILKDEFTHDFSHEFKTPIASINGFANLLLEGGISEEEKRQYLKIISDESARLSALAENTLMLSRLENQQFICDEKKYRLDLQIKECVILLEREWSGKEITISSELSASEYSGNEALMRQVWLNLLSNAIKFTPPHGEISVNLTEHGGEIKVEVSDNGIGMSRETLSHIFDKYYQGNSSRSTSGNGLGLAIVKRILTLCGGNVEAESREGEGSTFTVTLNSKK